MGGRGWREWVGVMWEGWGRWGWREGVGGWEWRYQTNKAKQHNIPKAVTFPKENELPQVGLDHTRGSSFSFGKLLTTCYYLNVHVVNNPCRSIFTCIYL